LVASFLIYVKRLFKTPLNDYDVIIHLKKDAIVHPERNIEEAFDNQIKKPMRRRVEYKNLMESGLLIGFDPVQKYLEELQVQKLIFFLF
jgi:hypothetical protein